jgi:GNAT superfamily N-acetyltransferase
MKRSAPLAAAPGIAGQLREGLGRRGARGLAREGLELVRRAVWRRENHNWYEIQLARMPAMPPLPDDMRLVVATDADLAAVEQLGGNVASARRRAARGHQQMLLFDGDRPVFGCWVFHGAMPDPAAHRGTLVLPDDTVCIEDSVTNPDSRRRGVSTIAGGAVITHLRSEGIRTMLTRVAVSNVPAHKAVLKTGFREVARVTMQRIGPRKHVDVEILNDSSTGQALARRFR